ncbi:hypothetical protein C0991_011166 [Blastosporella zonata]|nr:hypothetical protein C0991_011166 [Blastosporella zonata]
MQVMNSAGGTTDSRHSRSLLQSRSLRDFRNLPPPPLPEKSRRRVLQVNGPYVVRQVCPPIPRISEPSHDELVQTQQNPRSKSPMQVSPFIAAPRASFDTGTSSPDSSYGAPPSAPIRSSSSPSVKGVHGLRNPPVNPRRHRRLCSDFGLDRDQSLTSPSPPVTDISSMASTPLTTYTETESDSDTSVNQALEYAFPEPPPIDEALHLRRMHSSPMFNQGEPDQVREFLRKRWGPVAEASKGSPPAYHHWDGVSNISIDSRYTSDLEDLVMTHPTINRITVDSSPRIRREYTQSFSSHVTPLKSNISMPLPSSRRGDDISWKRATTTPMARDRTNAITSFSSTRSPSSIGTKRDLPFAKVPSSPMARRSSRPPPELSEPMDRLDLSIEKLKRHDPHNLQSNCAAVTGGYPRIPQPPLPLSPPSLASAGRKKPTHRPHLLTPVLAPVAGPGLSDANENPPTSIPAKDGGIVLNHPAPRNHSVPRGPQLEPVPKSFMDITPEREVQRGSRARVRKLLKRASVSMFSWGKTKTVSK